MRRSISELIAALSGKGEVIRELISLLQVEQSCLSALDIPKLEENQQAILTAMERMSQISETCQGRIASVSAELGIAGNSTLSPIIARLPQPEQVALRDAQLKIAGESQALNGALALNRGLLEDSLKVVDRSATFFNRLFNPGDTYGMAGSLVSRRGGSRFVCKEV